MHQKLLHLSTGHLTTMNASQTLLSFTFEIRLNIAITPSIDARTLQSLRSASRITWQVATPVFAKRNFEYMSADLASIGDVRKAPLLYDESFL